MYAECELNMKRFKRHPTVRKYITYELYYKNMHSEFQSILTPWLAFYFYKRIPTK
jgi:hypothetical protein